jgi:tRNA pseudouridine38-40 synthase
LKLRLDLAYDGTPFHGFARQKDVRTVQGELEDALGKLLHGEVTTACAGRTDAGVHALGQVVSVPDVPNDLDLDRTAEALNAMLGPHVAITSCTQAPDDFHARFSARSRTYVYAILDGPQPDPFLARTAWHRPTELDVDRMDEAAGHLVGPHDFSSFGRVDDGGSADRTLFELSCTRDGRVVKLHARANSFIQQMVRSIVGTLAYVGEGRRDPGDIPGVISASDRSAAGPVAPPHGLCLVSVEYDDGWSSPVEIEAV